jgi:hypothetical protein
MQDGVKVADTWGTGSSIDLGGGVASPTVIYNEALLTYNAAGVLESALRNSSALSEMFTGISYDASGAVVQLSRC